MNIIINDDKTLTLPGVKEEEQFSHAEPAEGQTSVEAAKEAQDAPKAHSTVGAPPAKPGETH